MDKQPCQYLDLQPRDYQLEATEDMVDKSSAGRPKVLIVMGNPDQQGGGKSRMIDAMLNNKAFDVRVVRADEIRSSGEQWHAAIFDELREHNVKEWETITIDSFAQMPHILERVREPVRHEYGSPGKRAHKGSVGRSRAARAERWR